MIETQQFIKKSWITGMFDSMQKGTTGGCREFQIEVMKNPELVLCE